MGNYGFFGVGIQVLLILAVLAAYVVFIISMLKNLWRRQLGSLFKIVWALIIIGVPWAAIRVTKIRTAVAQAPTRAVAVMAEVAEVWIKKPQRTA